MIPGRPSELPVGSGHKMTLARRCAHADGIDSEINRSHKQSCQMLSYMDVIDSEISKIDAK